MPTKQELRAFGYVRISKETADTTSPPQRQAIASLCRERGWKLLEVFEDIDRSAYRGKHRPGFDEMMRRLGETDAIVFWTLSRLSRSAIQSGEIARATKDAGVHLVATDMNIDTTSAGPYAETADVSDEAASQRCSLPPDNPAVRVAEEKITPMLEDPRDAGALQGRGPWLHIDLCWRRGDRVRELRGRQGRLGLRPGLPVYRRANAVEVVRAFPGSEASRAHDRRDGIIRPAPRSRGIAIPRRA